MTANFSYLLSCQTDSCPCLFVSRHYFALFHLFLTSLNSGHLSLNPSMETYGSDPFFGRPSQDVRAPNPYLGSRSAGQPNNMGKQSPWNISNFLGPGEEQGGKWGFQILVLAPWVLFSWVVLIWLIVKHSWESLVLFFVATQIILSLACTGVGYLGKGQFGYPVFGLGVLCLFATVAAMLVGIYGWNNYTEQYWWTTTGPSYNGLMPTDIAQAYSDAAVLRFTTDNSTVDGVAVDHMRSAGYRDGGIFCVAPILNAAATQASLTRVQYWAIGIDCCDNVGNFYCDDSRMHTASYAVVMLNGGMPCVGCNADKFRAAVEKAENLFGFVTASGALHVRWMSDANTFSSSLYWKTFSVILISVVVAFLLLCVLAACVHRVRMHALKR